MLKVLVKSMGVVAYLVDVVVLPGKAMGLDDLRRVVEVPQVVPCFVAVTNDQVLVVPLGDLKPLLTPAERSALRMVRAGGGDGPLPQSHTAQGAESVPDA